MRIAQVKTQNKMKFELYCFEASQGYTVRINLKEYKVYAWRWWHMSLILASGRKREANTVFEASLI